MPNVTSSDLLQTIVTDLKSGVSFLENEAASAGLFLWNTVKAVFIALEPAEAAVLQAVLTAAVNAADGSHTIEQIESAALNTAKGAEQAVLVKAGSGIVQTVIAGLRASQLP